MVHSKKIVENQPPVYLPKIDKSAIEQPKNDIKISFSKADLKEMHARPEAGMLFCADFNIFSQRSADGSYGANFTASDSNKDGKTDYSEVSVFKNIPQWQRNAHHFCKLDNGKQVFESNIRIPTDDVIPIYSWCEYDSDGDGKVDSGNESNYFENSQLQSNVSWNNTSGGTHTRVDYFPNGKINKNPTSEQQYSEVITYIAPP